MFWTGPTTQPADLGQRLEVRGFSHDSAPGMTLDLSTLAIRAGWSGDYTGAGRGCLSALSSGVEERFWNTGYAGSDVSEGLWRDRSE